MIRSGSFAPALAAILILPACHPYTTRPPFPPITGAPFADLNLSVPRATGVVVEAFQDDSLPLSHVDLKDGIIETPWFDATTLAATKARRLGPNVVQVRAWVDPTKPGASRVTIETIYRPVADPSLADRELDRPVPPDHPVGKRVGELVSDLVKTYGTPVPDSTAAGAASANPGDSTAARDSTCVSRQPSAVSRQPLAVSC